MDKGNPIAHVWMDRAQTLAALQVSPRTLSYYCKRGQVDRRKVGRSSFYRLADAGNRGNEPEQRSNIGATITATGQGPGQLALAVPESGPRPAAQFAPLVRLVEQLTADLASASAERGEAIGVGFMLAEQRDRAEAERDRLAAQLAELQRALFNLSDTARAWPVRKQLLTALVRSTPLMDTQLVSEYPGANDDKRPSVRGNHARNNNERREP